MAYDSETVNKYEDIYNATGGWAKADLEGEKGQLDLDALVDALNRDSEETEIVEVLVEVLQRDLGVRKNERVLDEIRNNIKAKVKTFDILIDDAKDQIAAAAMKDVKAATAPPWWNPPRREFGQRFNVRRYAARLWMFRDNKPICSLFTVDAGVVHPDRPDLYGDHGLTLTIDGPDGKAITVRLPSADLVGGRGATALKTLRRAGMVWEADADEWIIGYLTAIQPRAIPLYDRAGWRETDGGDRIFIRPTGEVLLAETEDAAGISERSRLRCATTGGTEEEWLAGAKFLYGLGEGFVPLQAAIPLGGVGAIVQLADFDTPIYSLEGLTSSTKSTIEQIAAGFWADCKLTEGLFISANITPTSAENKLQRSTGTILALDEIRRLVGDAQDFVFMIQSGQGKGRGKTDGGDRLTNKWSTCVLVSGETGLAQQIDATGAGRANGVAARALPINVDGVPTIEDWSKVEAVSRLNFGYGGPLFIKALADQGYVKAPESLRKFVDEKRDLLAQHGLDEGQEPTRLQRRSARLPALIWAAAEIMQNAEIIPADYDAEAMAVWLWEGAQASALGEQDPDRSLRKLRQSVFAERGRSVIPPGELKFADGTPRSVSVTTIGYMGADIRSSDLLLINAERRKRKLDPLASRTVYVILASELLKLSGGSLAERALRKVLVEKDIAIPFPRGKKGKNEIPWDSFPGLSRAQYMVLRADQIDAAEL